MDTDEDLVNAWTHRRAGLYEREAGQHSKENAGAEEGRSADAEVTGIRE